MKRFPKILHVTVEGDREPYFQVNELGVHDAAEVGKSKPLAIYQLVEVGTVIAPPKFVSKRKTRG